MCSHKSHTIQLQTCTAFISNYKLLELRSQAESGRGVPYAIKTYPSISVTRQMNLLFCAKSLYVTGFVRVSESFGKFWKITEIDSAFFQDLESFGKGAFFKVAMECFGLLFGKILKYPKIDTTYCRSVRDVN